MEQTAEYVTVTGESSSEHSEKRSRFIAVLTHCETEEEAACFINKIRSENRDARHNCYAYSVCGGAVKRFSDDGEPHGTAGKPMLDIIEGEDIKDVCAVVTRYFGGVLLGTGGLVRAYSKALKDALSAAKKAVMLPCTVFSCTCSYAETESLNRLIRANGGTVTDSKYGEFVDIYFFLPDDKKDGFLKGLSEDFCARLTAAEIGQKSIATEVGVEI